jgi:phosphoenolpyruvate synthase/pyruvate phosphate dikinase
MIERYVVGLEEVDKTQVALVGGKGAHWGSYCGSKAFACRLDFA